MPTAGYREPDELRGSRPVLRERGGETPPRHSPENLAETVPLASRFCRAAAPDGDIGNENGEPRAPMGPARVAHNARDGIDWPACAQRAATATDGIDGWRSSQQWNSSTAGWGVGEVLQK